MVRILLASGIGLLTDRYRGSEGTVESTEKSNSPFSLSRFLLPPPLPFPLTPEAAV